VVEPIDDSIPERIESVVLSLKPPSSTSTSAPPAYLIGFPARAAAIIVDNDQPRPASCRLNEGLFHLCLPGTNGYGYSVSASGDLVNWTSLGTNVVTDGAIHYVDPDAVGLGQRFYQVAPAPGYSPPQ